jgi:type I restriction enzyme M protein
LKNILQKEVLPHVPDAWIDYDKTRIGYEINFTKYFYEYKGLRPSAEIKSEWNIGVWFRESKRHY